MDQDRQPPPRASNRSCVAHRRADPPETGLRSSQHVLARTTDVSASSPHEATQPITQAFLQSTLSASTIFESWLSMDSEIVRKGNCNASLAIVGKVKKLLPRRHDIDFPGDRRTGVSVEETLRGDRNLLGVLAVGRH